ncbi:4-hydroxy-tetrahydrodipicolinate synthase [Scatolibacter rhodanostii]|uniref:4-hydroxy-tetrahydrodipicolinate synthase n=1 Tax=Scatolibacter rhodanostii TaxID=2014781 RepID=UPI000C07BCD0|nr:4-hydroxy-tetrahydrodipicolinate synthase [Scatolibacter rhodanostii]
MKEILFTGSGVALVTPFDENRNINYEELEKLIEFQIENKTDAIIACGTTGESSTMTEKEHLDVIGFIIDKVAGRIPVIAGTGSNDTRTAVELSVHAKELGADGILLITPYYNKTSQKGLVEHYNYIANEAKIPAIVYNVPSRTGLNILPETYLEISKNPYIVATKEANGNAGALAHTISLCGNNLHVYSGEDNMTLPIIAMGGLGIISVFANALPKEMHNLAQAALDGDLAAARALSNEYLDLMDGFFMDVNPIAIKDAMNQMGLVCGPCRMPLTSMTDANHAKMQALLQKHGLI